MGLYSILCGYIIYYYGVILYIPKIAVATSNTCADERILDRFSVLNFIYTLWVDAFCSIVASLTLLFFFFLRNNFVFSVNFQIEIDQSRIKSGNFYTTVLLQFNNFLLEGYFIIYSFSFDCV